jgi:peptide/nickel transport system permease protein
MTVPIARAVRRPPPAPRVRRPVRRRRVPRDPAGTVGVAVLLLIVLACVMAPLLTAADPNRVELRAQFAPPTWAHPFGTDNFGRDLWARVLYGGRISLAIAGLVIVFALGIGVALGLIAGYRGGVVDTALMRLVDVTLAFPQLVLAILIVGVLGGGLRSLTIAIVAVSWARYARFVRGLTLQAREEGYVLAARAIGGAGAYIARRHLLPAIAGRVMVLVSLDIGAIILNVSAFSFLGLGVQPPTPEWGAMLNEGRVFFAQAPQVMLYPGLAIFLTVLTANLAGDALSDLFAPHLRPA